MMLPDHGGMMTHDDNEDDNDVDNVNDELDAHTAHGTRDKFNIVVDLEMLHGGFRESLMLNGKRLHR